VRRKGRFLPNWTVQMSNRTKFRSGNGLVNGPDSAVVDSGQWIVDGWMGDRTEVLSLSTSILLGLRHRQEDPKMIPISRRETGDGTRDFRELRGSGGRGRGRRVIGRVRCTCLWSQCHQ
jgi:hypothetical protein